MCYTYRIFSLYLSDATQKLPSVQLLSDLHIRWAFDEPCMSDQCDHIEDIILSWLEAAPSLVKYRMKI